MLPQGPELDDERAATEMQFGAARGALGQWASCVRVIDPATASTASVSSFIRHFECKNKLAILQIRRNAKCPVMQKSCLGR